MPDALAERPFHLWRAVLIEGYDKCEKAVVAQCRELLESQLEGAGE